MVNYYAIRNTAARPAGLLRPKSVCLRNGQALSLAGLPRLEDGGEGLFHPRLGE